MKQITFDLYNKNNSYHPEDFIVSLSNHEAFKHITSNAIWPTNRLLILGEEGSGKTHLANIWQQRQNAVFINSFTELQNLGEKHNSFILDDMHLCDSETSLFDIINHCQNNSFNLLMLATNLPKTFKLPDLASRINATKKVLIKTPDTETLKVILTKFFFENQLKVSPEVVEYISTRIERSYSFIRNFAYSLDNLSLEQKRNITIPLAKQLLDQTQGQ